MLYRTNGLIFLSLALSLLLFFVIDNKVISITNSNAEVFANQPLIVDYNQEEYAIEGIPKTVTVTMIGKSADLYLAKQLPKNAIKLDLSDLKEGTHRVSVKYNQSLGGVRYIVDPSVITVTVYQKHSVTRNVTVDILNQDALNSRLAIESVDLSRDEVLIKGPRYKLDQVASVKALVDVRDVNAQGTGTVKVTDVRLVAYNHKGNKIAVDIVPGKVTAELIITSPSKEVPIRVIPEGKVVFGKAISLIESSVSKVTIYGSEEVLKNINYIPVRIDVNNLSRNREYNVAIKKPVGIRSLSSTNTKISVTLGSESTKQFDDVYIEYRNLADGLNVQAASAADIKISVIVKGDKSILDKLDLTTITAYVDLKGYKEGRHDIDVVVTGSDPRLSYQAKTRKISLNIVK